MACLCIKARASVKCSRVEFPPGEPALAMPQPARWRMEASPQCNATRPRAAAGVSWAAERRCLGPAWLGASRPVRVSGDAAEGLPGLVGSCSSLPLSRLGLGGLQRCQDSGGRKGDKGTARGMWSQLIPVMLKLCLLPTNAQPWGSNQGEPVRGSPEPAPHKAQALAC